METKHLWNALDRAGRREKKRERKLKEAAQVEVDVPIKHDVIVIDSIVADVANKNGDVFPKSVLMPLKTMDELSPAERERVDQEVRKWVRDPNYIGLLPRPISFEGAPPVPWPEGGYKMPMPGSTKKKEDE